LPLPVILAKARIQIDCLSRPAYTRAFLDSSLRWNDGIRRRITGRIEPRCRQNMRVKNPRLRPVVLAKAGNHVRQVHRVL